MSNFPLPILEVRSCGFLNTFFPREMGCAMLYLAIGILWPAKCAKGSQRGRLRRVRGMSARAVASPRDAVCFSCPSCLSWTSPRGVGRAMRLQREFPRFQIKVRASAGGVSFGVWPAAGTSLLSRPLPRPPPPHGAKHQTPNAKLYTPKYSTTGRLTPPAHLSQKHRPTHNSPHLTSRHHAPRP